MDNQMTNSKREKDFQGKRETTADEIKALSFATF